MFSGLVSGWWTWMTGMNACNGLQTDGRQGILVGIEYLMKQGCFTSQRSTIMLMI